MKAIQGVCAVVCALVLIGSAYAQPAKKEAPAAAADKDFVPEVGQAGKDVVWVPTALTLVNKMLDMTKLTPQDILYDLGSGDGRTVITAAKRGATAFGVEFNPDMVALSRRNAAKEGVANKATFVQADFSKATVVTLFLLPELNVKLRSTILDMRPGTRVAANSFDMGDWKPDQTARVEGDCSSWCTAYLWIVPAKVAGTWKLAHGELTFAQQYQNITGTLRMNDRTINIANGKLDGDAISFNAGGVQYTGRVSGNNMDGTMAAGTARSPWGASRTAGGK
jgi:Methyltransferase domain